MTTRWCLKVEDKGKYHNLNSLKISSDAFVFSERSSSPNKFIKNSTVDNSIKPLRYKSNEEIF